MRKFKRIAQEHIKKIELHKASQEIQHALSELAGRLNVALTLSQIINKSDENQIDDKLTNHKQAKFLSVEKQLLEANKIIDNVDVKIHKLLNEIVY